MNESEITNELRHAMSYRQILSAKWDDANRRLIEVTTELAAANLRIAELESRLGEVTE